MHILALDPHSGAGPYAVTDRAEGTIRMLPAITTNGRISLLSAGGVEDYNKLLAAVRDRVLQRPKDSASYVCVAVSVSRLDSLGESLLVFEVLSSPNPSPELEQIYLLLTNLRVKGDDNWTKTEKYLQSEPVRSWINRCIDIWKQGLNWTQLVESALESHGDFSRRGGRDY